MQALWKYLLGDQWQLSGTQMGDGRRSPSVINLKRKLISAHTEGALSIGSVCLSVHSVCMGSDTIFSLHVGHRDSSMCFYL